MLTNIFHTLGNKYIWNIPVYKYLWLFKLFLFIGLFLPVLKERFLEINIKIRSFEKCWVQRKGTLQIFVKTNLVVQIFVKSFHKDLQFTENKPPGNMFATGFCLNILKTKTKLVVPSQKQLTTCLPPKHSWMI